MTIISIPTGGTRSGSRPSRQDSASVTATGDRTDIRTPGVMTPSGATGILPGHITVPTIHTGAGIPTITITDTTASIPGIRDTASVPVTSAQNTLQILAAGVATAPCQEGHTPPRTPGASQAMHLRVH